jgi:hypothetical protein
MVSCDAPISGLFSIGEAEKRNSPVSSLSEQAEPTKPSLAKYGKSRNYFTDR